MGNYNPYAGQILGQEWTPIREEDVSLPAYSPSQAFGQKITMNTAQSLNELRWYARNYPSDMVLYGVVGEVYPLDTESLTGPIKRVLIPAISGTTTGSAITVGTSVQEAFLNPSDFTDVNVFMVNTYSPNPGFTAYFAGNTYANALNGKRILAVNVLYTMKCGVSLETLESQGAGDGLITMKFVSNTSSLTIGTSQWNQVGTNQVPFDYSSDFVTYIGVGHTIPYRRIPLGIANQYYNGATPTVTEWAPWIPADLARFEPNASAANRLGITVNYTAPSAPTAGFSINSTWEYMALEVFYCEENRVAVGIAKPSVGTLITDEKVLLNTNRITLRHPVTRAATPSVGPGSYTTLVYATDMPPAQTASSPNVDVESLRQLYAIPSVNGLSVRMPYPFDTSVEGEVFETEQSDIVPHLTLHTTSAVVTDSHAYGRQARAEVWGAFTATQEILDGAAGAATNYPQVRFYARRFGSTAVPLSLTRSSAATQTVQITPADFDALPAILDGWKEVTLRFPSTAIPSMGAGTNPQWIWSATGELPGNRWEVLGAAAPALSGIPGNLWNLNAQQLSTATYGTPSAGSTINLGWIPGIAPMVTATTDDQTADAVLIFSIDSPAPSGMAVSAGTQILTAASPACTGTTPACIPSSLSYNRVTWTLRSGAARDAFNRTVVSGWGSADSGQAWTSAASGGTYSVNGSQGVHAFPAASSNTNTSSINVGSPDQDLLMDFLIDAQDTAGSQDVSALVRMTDDNNFYRAQLVFTTAGVATFRIMKTVAGVSTTLVSQAITSFVFNAGTVYSIRFYISGSNLWAKVWATNNPEPDVWNLSTTDTTFTTGNSAGIRSNDNSAAGIAFNVLLNNFSVTPPAFGALELQRFDPVDAAFNTIMLATNPAVTGFSDYEARVGQQSVYRMRERNVYDFAGSFSAMVTGTVASPGVAGASTALTLFTSNSHQDGSINLAYSASWEGNPIEDFGWAESDQVTFQSMYQKNFPTAFHPLERGGESFQRTILVNAAGIPVVASQNGFRYLRDMAWDSVPYICVRDELGNRWYSTVLVPQGSRRRMRTVGHLDTATVRIVEVTDVPYPVDPT